MNFKISVAFLVVFFISTVWATAIERLSMIPNQTDRALAIAENMGFEPNVTPAKRKLCFTPCRVFGICPPGCYCNGVRCRDN